MDVARQICVLTISNKNTRSTTDQRKYLNELIGTGCPLSCPGLCIFRELNSQPWSYGGTCNLTADVFFERAPTVVVLRDPFSFGANHRWNERVTIVLISSHRNVRIP